MVACRQLVALHTRPLGCHTAAQVVTHPGGRLCVGRQEGMLRRVLWMVMPVWAGCGRTRDCCHAVHQVARQLVTRDTCPLGCPTPPTW
jgi:hypothetical protein